MGERFEPSGPDRPRVLDNLLAVSEGQLDAPGTILRPEARQRVRQSIEACEQSDIYSADELVRYAWNIEGTVDISQIPYADRQMLLKEILNDKRCAALEHVSAMVRLVLPHDEQLYIGYRQQVGAVVDWLMSRLPPEAVVTMAEFQTVAAELGVLPEEPAEWERFGRVFTFSDRVGSSCSCTSDSRALSRS